MNENELVKIINQECLNYYNDNILSDSIYKKKNSGGAIRGKNGNLVEKLSKKILSMICEYYGIKENEYLITGQRKDTFKIESDNGYIDVSTDIHFYIKNNLAIFIECKTYLDKSFLDRANSDMLHLKSKNPNSYTCVLALENSIPENVENFFLDQGNINEIYFLLDGKRQSKKPIWKKEFAKDLNINLLEIFIIDMINVIKQYI